MFWPFEELPLTGDWDNDGDVDLVDFVGFNGCMTDPDAAEPPLPQCLDSFDTDGDADVDLADFGGFQAAFASVD